MIDHAHIRLQASNAEEIDTAIPLIYSSGPDAFEYVFKTSKTDAKGFLRHAYQKEGGEFSFKNHYSLYHQDQMVGIGSIFNAKRAAKFIYADVKNIIQHYKLNSGGVAMRGLKVEKIIKLPVQSEIAIGHLAIIPTLRGRGLGTILIQRLIAQLDPSDEQHLVLDVSEENPKAKALYERIGFQTTRRYASNLKNQYSYVPNHYRMEWISK